MQGQNHPLQIRIWPSSRRIGISELQSLLSSHDRCTLRSGAYGFFAFVAGEFDSIRGSIFIVTHLKGEKVKTTVFAIFWLDVRWKGPLLPSLPARNLESLAAKISNVHPLSLSDAAMLTRDISGTIFKPLFSLEHPSESSSSFDAQEAFR